MTRRHARSAFCLAALLLVAAPARTDPSSAPAAVDEASVKAELVERFCRFIDWPEGALGPSDRPFVIGILGTDPVAPHLEDLARLRMIQGRPVEVRRLATPAGAGDCNLVWIAASAKDRLAAVLAKTRGRAILTIGDSPGFAGDGVLIGLVRSGDHVSFEINLDEVRQSGLQFSSKLLRLGTIVGRAKENGR